MTNLKLTHNHLPRSFALDSLSNPCEIASQPNRAFKSLTKAFSVGILGMAMVLSGCQQPASSDNSHNESTSSNAADSGNKVHDITAGSQDDEPDVTVNNGLSQPIEIDWTKIDSGVEPVNPATFNYPFALDSQPVKSYMTFFDVDAKTAQHNLTVGMASNEALSLVLDQLSNRYVSHELTDGSDIKLVIHTTNDAAPSRYNYVFNDSFARGLTLPIEIRPDGKKSSKSHQANPHEPAS